MYMLLQNSTQAHNITILLTGWLLLPELCKRQQKTTHDSYWLLSFISRPQIRGYSGLEVIHKDQVQLFMEWPVWGWKPQPWCYQHHTLTNCWSLKPPRDFASFSLYCLQTNVGKCSPGNREEEPGNRDKETVWGLGQFLFSFKQQPVWILLA